VTILSTPGHTPGHQSLLVRLPKTATSCSRANAVHFRKWTVARPAMNVNREQTLGLAAAPPGVLDERRARLWINHDKPQSDGLRYAPRDYE